MNSRRTNRREAGVALVVTLMMMSILTMMVVGLSGVMRNEQAAARNLTYQVLAEQMAEIGAREGMATVLSNSPTSGVVSVTGPGWTATNGRLVTLFSSNTGTQTVDLENLGTNSLILSVGPNQTGRITVHWTNVIPSGGDANLPAGRYAWWVDDEGTKANLRQVGGDKTNASTTTSLLPLQTNFPLSAAQFFLDDPVAGEGVNPAKANRLATNGFAILATPEMLKLPTNRGGVGLSFTNYNSFKGQMTVWSSNADLTPWGTPKFNLANLTNTNLYPAATSAVAALKAVLMTNALTNFFGAGTSLGRKYGGGSTTTTNAGNHGDLVIEQIAANILAAMGRPVLLTNPSSDYQTNLPTNSFFRHRSGMPLRIASHSSGPYLDEVRCRVAYSRSGNSLNTRLEVGVQIVNPYDRTFTNYSLEIRPRKFRFNITSPANMTAANASLKVTTTNFSLPDNTTYWENNGRSVWAGPSTLSGTEFFLWPWNRPLTASNLTLLPRSTNFVLLPATFICTFTTSAGSSTASQAYLILDQVALYRGAPAATNLTDWMTLDDLNQLGNFRSPLPEDAGQFNFSGTRIPILTTNLPTSISDFSSGNSHGLKKIDPQARFALLFWNTSTAANSTNGDLRAGGWVNSATGPRIWTTNRTFNCTNTNGSVTGLTYLWPDPAPGVTTVTNHPHFTPGFYTTNIQGLQSIAQLGAIHTGIPWRTLRFLPTPTGELAQGPPDWVLLDMFTVTNSSDPRPMINVNSVGMDREGIIRVAGTDAHRAWAMLGAMGTLSNSYPNFFQSSSLSNNLANLGIPQTFATDPSAAMSASGASGLMALGPALRNALVNPKISTNWYSNSVNGLVSGWGSWRAGANSNWPANGFAFRGELVEMPILTQTGNTLSEEQQEGRLRFFMDLLTTRSDTFTAWSVGQGLVVFTNSLGRRQTNIMGEVRRQTVFQRTPMYATNVVGGLPSLSVTNWRVEVLYSRDHVVE